MTHKTFNGIDWIRLFKMSLGVAASVGAAIWFQPSDVPSLPYVAAFSVAGACAHFLMKSFVPSAERARNWPRSFLVTKARKRLAMRQNILAFIYFAWLCTILAALPAVAFGMMVFLGLVYLDIFFHRLLMFLMRKEMQETYKKLDEAAAQPDQTSRQ